MLLLLLSNHLGAVPRFLDTPREEDRARTRIAYVDDASIPFGDAGFVANQRRQLSALGYEVSDITVGQASPTDAQALFSRVDAVYLASGASDALMHALRSSGTDRVLVDKAQQGLPIIGCGAGSVALGLSTEPDVLMDGATEGLEDEPAEALGLVGSLIVVHADGQLPPYPKTLINDVVRQLGTDRPITLISDDQALLVRNSEVRIIDSPPMYAQDEVQENETNPATRNFKV